MASQRASIVDDWLEEDNLILLESLARDGYQFQDIANVIGISVTTLARWRKEYPEIDKALKNGRRIVDYKVENALLKSALGYKTKEVRTTTIMRYGKVVETQKEILEKEQTPNVTACQVWLYNRKPDTWKKNRESIIDLDEEDTSIQITVVKASNGKSEDNNEEDKEWQDEVNTKIEIKKNKDEKETKNTKGKAENKEKKESKSQTKKEVSADLDFWPEDWEDED